MSSGETIEELREIISDDIKHGSFEGIFIQDAESLDWDALEVVKKAIKDYGLECGAIYIGYGTIRTLDYEQNDSVQVGKLEAAMRDAKIDSDLVFHPCGRGEIPYSGYKLDSKTPRDTRVSDSLAKEVEENLEESINRKYDVLGEIRPKYIGAKPDENFSRLNITYVAQDYANRETIPELVKKHLKELFGDRLKGMKIILFGSDRCDTLTPWIEDISF